MQNCIFSILISNMKVYPRHSVESCHLRSCAKMSSTNDICGTGSSLDIELPIPHPEHRLQLEFDKELRSSLGYLIP